MRNLARAFVVLIVAGCGLYGCATASPARTKVIPGSAQVHRESTTQGARESTMKFNVEAPTPPPPTKIKMRVFVDSPEKQKETTP